MSLQEMGDTAKKSDQLGRAADLQDVEGENTYFYEGSSRSYTKSYAWCWANAVLQYGYGPMKRLFLGAEP